MSFSLSKILGALLEPGNLLAVCFLLAALFAISPWDRAKSFGRRAGILLGFIIFIFSVIPIGEWVLAPLENKYADVKLPEKVDGIVFLTGDESPYLMEVRGVPVAGYAAQRYLYLARILKKYPKAKIVIAGTTTWIHPRTKFTTRALAEEILPGIGIPKERVIFEENSRNTYENAKNTLALAKPKEGETWVLLTSAFHMPRSVMAFEKAGWKVTPASSDFMTSGSPEMIGVLNFGRQIGFLDTAAHEYVGFLYYWLRGWIDRPW